MRLKGRIAIVTGGASGIGLDIVQRFAREGAAVAIADLKMEAARRAADDIEGTGGRALAVAMDVTDEAAVDGGVDAVVNHFGAVDIVVSNAGIQHIDPIDELQLADWRRVLAIHLDGAFLVTRAALRHMYPAGNGGCLLYMGSVHSKVASPLKAPYVTAKHGLEGLCRTVAKEGANRNVRANLICPGFVKTPLVAKQIPEQAEELGISEDEVVRTVMLKDTIDGEFTTTEDVAQVAVDLASFPSTALSGQSVIVSHGWHME